MEPASVDVSSSRFSAEMEEEAQEDILLLKAYMGHFDEFLGKTDENPHLVDPHPVDLANRTKKAHAHPSTPAPSRHSIVEILDSDTEEDLAKGETRRKRRADRPPVIDLDAEEDEGEEDFEAMKMKRYNTAPEDEVLPSAKRPCPLPLSGDSQSAPATPILSVKAKTTLNAVGRYYEDGGSGSVAKNCRFCAAARGITFHEPRDSQRFSCFNCGGNHVARDCHNIMCYNCWELGHRSNSCRNPRAPHSTCYRCRGSHDPIDCLALTGVVRLGASESSKKADAIPLPISCSNCGFQGHAPRQCPLAPIEDTNMAFERDGPEEWMYRMQIDVQRLASSFKSPDKPKTHTKSANRNQGRDNAQKPQNKSSPSPNKSKTSDIVVHVQHKAKSLPSTPKPWHGHRDQQKQQSHNHNSQQHHHSHHGHKNQHQGQQHQNNQNRNQSHQGKPSPHNRPWGGKNKKT